MGSTIVPSWELQDSSESVHESFQFTEIETGCEKIISEVRVVPRLYENGAYEAFKSA
jgi:hypothetical protein